MKTVYNWKLFIFVFGFLLLVTENITVKGFFGIVIMALVAGWFFSVDVIEEK